MKENDTTATQALQSVTFASIMGESKTRDEVLQQIRKNDRTYQKFLHMPFSYQEKLLDFLCGKRGLEIVYDPFFQHIFHPGNHPERLENFLGEYLGTKSQRQLSLQAYASRLSDHSNGAQPGTIPESKSSIYPPPQYYL